MDQYIARQPIFNAFQKVYGYELLYRGAKHYTLDLVSSNQATTSLLTSTFITRDIKEISSYRPCFINFTQDLLEKMLPASFPKSAVVVEILEDVEPTKKVLSACRQLRDQGYTLALDDFVFDRKLLPLLELVDIVKIDFRLTPYTSLMSTLAKLAPYKVKLLAEKVETIEEFEGASKLGFKYFQGYFFSRPEKIKIKELSITKVTKLRLLAEVAKKQTTVENLRDIIANDVSVSYKLLRFLNSSYFYRLQEVKSVRHAIAYLGEKELRRFLMLVIVSAMSNEKPGELIRLGLVRAKFCELLGQSEKGVDNSSELFIIGLFSLLDAMLDTTMQNIMNILPVSNSIKTTLLTDNGPFNRYLQIAKSYERNREDIFSPLLADLGLNAEEVNSHYLTAIKYANGFI